MFRNFNDSAIGNQTALHCETSLLEFLFEAVEQNTFQTEGFELIRTVSNFGGTNRFRIGNGGDNSQTEKGPEGKAISDLILHLIIGKVVYRFQDKDFEHQEFIEWWSTSIGESFFPSNFGEGGTKNLPIDEGVEFGKEVIDLRHLGELFSEWGIEKRGLSGVHRKKTGGENARQ